MGNLKRSKSSNSFKFKRYFRNNYGKIISGVFVLWVLVTLVTFVDIVEIEDASINSQEASQATGISVTSEDFNGDFPNNSENQVFGVYDEDDEEKWEEGGVTSPEITAIEPFHGPAEGNFEIFIRGFRLKPRLRVNISTGEDGGSSLAPSVEVRVGGQPCLAVHLRSGALIHCTAPPGTGSRLSLSVTITDRDGGVRETQPNTLFSYDAPSLSSISPRMGRTAGASLITLTGTNFGPPNLGVTPRVMIGELACGDVQLRSDKELVCRTAPKPSPGPLIVKVEVGPQDHVVAALNNLTFFYVQTPKEKLVDQVRLMMAGTSMKFWHKSGKMPMMMNRKASSGNSLLAEVAGGDSRSAYSSSHTPLLRPDNTGDHFAIPPHLYEVLPDTDYRKAWESCAVVGEGAVLLGQPQLGALINNHTAVIRLAHAPVKGFEQYVGSKTTLRIASEPFLQAMLKFKMTSNAREAEEMTKLQRLQMGGSMVPLVVWTERAQELYVRLHPAFKGKPPMWYVSAPVRHQGEELYRHLRDNFQTLDMKDWFQHAEHSASEEASEDDLRAYEASVVPEPPAEDASSLAGPFSSVANSTTTTTTTTSTVSTISAKSDASSNDAAWKVQESVNADPHVFFDTTNPSRSETTDETPSGPNLKSSKPSLESSSQDPAVDWDPDADQDEDQDGSFSVIGTGRVDGFDVLDEAMSNSEASLPTKKLKPRQDYDAAEVDDPPMWGINGYGKTLGLRHSRRSHSRRMWRRRRRLLDKGGAAKSEILSVEIPQRIPLKEPSVEFAAVILALQFCQRVTLFGLSTPPTGIDLGQINGTHAKLVAKLAESLQPRTYWQAQADRVLRMSGTSQSIGGQVDDENKPILEQRPALMFGYEDLRFPGVGPFNPEDVEFEARLWQALVISRVVQDGLDIANMNKT